MIAAVGLLSQRAIAAPGVADGAGEIVNVLVDVTFEQPAFALAVNVNVTLPAEISAPLGVYVAKVNDVWLLHVPVPLEVQFTLA